MKRIKRLASFMLAMVMVLSMALTVSAAENEPGNVTPQAIEGENNPTDTSDLPAKPTADGEANLAEHTYTAYQIFKGDLVENEDSPLKGTLLNIDWGEGINANDFLTALKKSTEFGTSNPFKDINYDTNATNKSADAVARVIKDWEEDKDYARAFARLADANKKTGAGIKTGDTLDAGYYLVVDETQSIGGVNSARNLSFLQMGQGEAFNPVTKTDVPVLDKKVKEVNDSDHGGDGWKDAADYDIGDTVEFVLTGTLPTDYDRYTKYKYVFHDTLSAGLELDSNSIEVYIDRKKVSMTEGGYTVAAPGADGESLTVSFADLKSNTSIDANSVIQVKYSATFNETDASGDFDATDNTAHLEYSNDPNNTGDGTTGTTPEDKVTVFSYNIKVNKTNEAGEALEGAEFTLYKKDVNSTEEDKYIKVEKSAIISGDKDNIFTFKGIDAGMYKLVESKVPAGYNKADDMYFTVEASIGEVDGVQKVTELKIAEVTKINAKGEMEKITDSKGNAVFTFTAMAMVDNEEVVTDTLSADIVNKSGVTLPSTGGIGTTIFYVVGGILVLGAGLLLVTKRRMKSN